MNTLTGEIAALGEGLITGTSGSPQAAMTVGDGTSTWVTAITLVNTDSSNRTVNVFINRGGTRRRISPKDMTCRPGYMITLDDGYSLQSGHSIDLDASAASVVEYSIQGLEKSQ